VLIAGKLAIVTLFTTKFANAFEPLLWLLPGTVLFSIANIFASYIAGIGKPMMNTLISASVVVCTIFFDMLLIPHYGIIGAAIASSIAYAMMTILTMIIFVRLTNLKSKQIFPLIKELSQDMKHSFQKSKQRIGL
jgi:O-antigen/teichoic acid export membrane protein